MWLQWELRYKWRTTIILKPTNNNTPLLQPNVFGILGEIDYKNILL